MTKRKKRVILCLAALVGSLLVAEGLLRIFNPQLLLWDVSEHWEPHDGLGRGPLKNIDLILNTGNRPARVIKNHHGHRVGPGSSGPYDLNILGIGDSFMEALQVDYEQTFCARLEQSLGKKLKKKVRITNAALGGWDPNQYFIKTREELEQSDYDALLVSVFLANDRINEVHTHFSPQTRLIKPRLTAPYAASMLRLTHHFLHSTSHLYTYLYYFNIGRQIRNGTIPDHMLRPVLKSEEDSPDWDLTLERLDEIKSLADAKGIPTLFVLIPPHYYFDDVLRNRMAQGLGVDVDNIDLTIPGRVLTGGLQSRDAAVMDVTPAMSAAATKEGHSLFGSPDVHLDPFGHQVVAEAVHPQLVTLMAPRPGVPDSVLVDNLLLKVPSGLITSMTVLPPDRLALGFRDGRLYILGLNDKALPDKPALELPTVPTIEGGIIGLTADPDFNRNQWLYVFYTEKDMGNGESLQIVRVKASQTIDPEAVQSILRIPDEELSEIHYGGGMAFDNSGCLLVGVGDDAVAENSQDPLSLRGKILRMNKDGSIPTDNPVFLGNTKPSLVYAMGLRNPFRLIQDPSTGNVYIHDSGASAYEEINLLQPSANYGWPVYEGYEPVRPEHSAPPHYAPPVVAIPHQENKDPHLHSRAITGGTFLTNQDHIAYFGTRYLCTTWERDGGWILAVTNFNTNVDAVQTVENGWAVQGAPVDLVHADGQLLYHTLTLDFGDMDQSYSMIRRLRIRSEPPPEPVLSAAKLSGTAPFQAGISVTGEHASIRWLVNGKEVSTDQELDYIFETAGVYQVDCRAVLDDGAYGASSTTCYVYQAHDVPLSIKLRDANTGQPLSGTLRLRDSVASMDSSVDVQIPIDGLITNITLDLLGEAVVATISAEGLSPCVIYADPGEGLQKTIQLSHQYYHARMVDPKSLPIPKTPITLLSPGPRSTNLLTDAAGYFILPAEPGEPATAVVPIGHPTLWPYEGYTLDPARMGAPISNLVFSPLSAAEKCTPPGLVEEEVPYEKVQAVFDRYCIGCHGNANPSGLLPLTRKISFTSCYNQPSKTVPGRKLLDPDDPEKSYLLEKMNCIEPSFGYFMPPSSRGLIPEDQRAAITSWVLQGMKQDH